MRLQEEEDRRAAAAASQEQYNTGQQPVRPDRRVREREDTRDRRDGKNVSPLGRIWLSHKYIEIYKYTFKKKCLNIYIYKLSS